MISMSINVAVGVWLIFAPQLCKYQESAAGSFDRVMGAMLVAFAMLAMWEVMAPLRWLCAASGLLLLFSPAWIPIENESSVVVHMITGLIVLGMSLLVRKPRHRYNGGWLSLVKRTKTDLGRITWS